MGKLNLALEYYSKAHDIYKNMKGIKSIDSIDTLTSMGIVYKRLGNMKKAKECFTLA
jgi:tetratricopeptide (TPR) repeat protein